MDRGGASGGGDVPPAFLDVEEISALDEEADAVSWRASGRIENLGGILAVVLGI